MQSVSRTNAYSKIAIKRELRLRSYCWTVGGSVERVWLRACSADSGRRATALGPHSLRPPLRSDSGGLTVDRLGAMETFVRVIETGSFSAAAKQLRVGQSAISKVIAKLEG